MSSVQNLRGAKNQVSASILIEKVTIFGRNRFFLRKSYFLQSSSEDFSFEGIHSLSDYGTTRLSEYWTKPMTFMNLINEFNELTLKETC
jgi:hypothetical protein